MAVAEWEEKYYINSEIDGVVELSDEINHNSIINAGELVGYVNPHESKQKYARLLISGDRRGQIQVGNRCLLKIDAYPYKEYGLVQSEVISMSLLSTKESEEKKLLYEVIVGIEDTIISEYDQELSFILNMSLVADIITEEQTLLHRLFNQFFDLIKNN